MELRRVEVPWGPAAEGPDTGGEGVRDLWGLYAAGERDEIGDFSCV